MKTKILYSIWLCLYILCVGMGTITPQTAVQSGALTVLSVIFFIPGVLLLIEGFQSNQKILKQVRIISLISLGLTLSLIVLNILTVNAGSAVGQTLNDVLLLVSAPMFCCHWQGVSLFLWACLFVSSFPKMWKK